jgi:hypothetical protein
MDGQGRCSSAEGRKDIDIFKSSDVFSFILQLGIEKDYLVQSGGFVLRLGCIRTIGSKKLEGARYHLKVVTVCKFG